MVPDRGRRSECPIGSYTLLRELALQLASTLDVDANEVARPRMNYKTVRLDARLCPEVMPATRRSQSPDLGPVRPNSEEITLAELVGAPAAENDSIARS